MYTENDSEKKEKQQEKKKKQHAHCYKCLQVMRWIGTNTWTLEPQITQLKDILQLWLFKVAKRYGGHFEKTANFSYFLQQWFELAKL